MAGETTPPERAALHPFLTTAPAVEALRQLERGLGARKPFVLVLGDPGTGKSMVAHEALRRWENRMVSAALSARDVAAESLASTLAARFGGQVKPDAVAIVAQERLVEALANATAGGRVAVLLVDDAHALTDEALLELSRLAGLAAKRQCPLEVLLSGEHSLAARLTEPGLAAAGANVSVRATVPPLSANDTRHYLLQRPPSEAGPGVAMFSRKACRDIHAATRGIVREVEALASEAVRVAQGKGSPTVSTDHVRAAERKLYGVKGAAQASAPKPPAKPAPAVRAEKKAAGASQASAPPAVTRRAEKSAVTEPPSESTTSQDALTQETVAGATPSDSRPAGDQRVKDWVSRFGGSGVNIGGMYAGRGKRDLEDLPDLSSVQAYTESAAPAVVAASQPTAAAAEQAPVAESGWRREVIERGELLAPSPAWLPPKPARDRKPGKGGLLESALVWQMCTLVMAIALVAVILGQRRVSSPAKPSAVAAQIAPEPPDDEAPRASRSATDAGKRSVVRATPDPDDEAVAKASEGDDETPQREIVAKVAAPSSATTPSKAAPALVSEPAHAKFAPTAPPPPAVVEKAPAVAGRRYTVGVGSFPEAGMARSERRQVERLTRHRVYVAEFRLGGVRMYRLEVGAFGSRTEAEAEARAMMTRGLTRGTDVVELDE